MKEILTSFSLAARLNLPAYPFAELERKASAIKAAGRPLYNLSIGDPELSPPEFVVEGVQKALIDPKSHLYPSSRGDRDVRRSVAKWFKGRFNVEIDPDTQVCILIGAKEGLGNLARGIVNPDDIVAIPDPAYPVYGRAGCRLVEGKPRLFTLNSGNRFLPDLDELTGAKLVYLNYPNNPTGVEADDDFLTQLGAFADDNPGTTIAYDMAYGEMYFGKPPRSLLEFTSNAIEFHSLSKMACATGYRVGFAVGEPQRIGALVKIKEELDSGAPLPFQLALKAMLDAYIGVYPPKEIKTFREVYRQRKESLTDTIGMAGYNVIGTNATFYVWFQVGDDEMTFISQALEHGLLLTPGSGFGTGGRGWVRASVTAPDEAIEAACEILRKL